MEFRKNLVRYNEVKGCADYYNPEPCSPLSYRDKITEYCKEISYDPIFDEVFRNRCTGGTNVSVVNVFGAPRNLRNIKGGLYAS